MAKLNVNPTRVELKRLSSKLQIAERGHTLLKEKQDSLIRKFMGMYEEARTKRRYLEERLADMYRCYQRASILTNDKILQFSLNASEEKLDITLSRDSILGVRVPKYLYNKIGVEEEIKSYILVPAELDNIKNYTSELSQKLVELVELENRSFLIGEEIIETKRRVNSLEFKTIPDLQETIVYIKMKIEDNERNQLAKLINMKE